MAEGRKYPMFSEQSPEDIEREAADNAEFDKFMGDLYNRSFLVFDEPTFWQIIFGR